MIGNTSAHSGRQKNGRAQTGQKTRNEEYTQTILLEFALDLGESARREDLAEGTNALDPVAEDPAS